MYGAVEGANKILPYFTGGKDRFRTNQGRLLEGV